MMQTQSLSDLLIDCQKLNNYINQELKKQSINIKSEIKNPELKILIDETINDYNQLITLLSNLQNLLQTDYFETMHNCSILGVNACIKNERLTCEEINIEQINDFIQLVINSEDYQEREHEFRQGQINQINELVGLIRKDYPTMPDLKFLESDIKNHEENYHPAWLTSKTLLEKIEIFTNSKKIDKVKNAGDIIIKQLKKAHRITERWDYCNEEDCNNFRYFTENNGSITCNNCGLVIREKIYKQYEPRAYDNEEVKKRRQHERIWQDFGPRTIIRVDKDSKGHLLTGKQKSTFNRLSKIHRSLFSSLERNFWESEPKLKMLKNVFGKIAYETAQNIYRRVAEKKITMGRSINNFIATTYYLALRINGTNKLLFDLMNDFRTISPEIERGTVTSYAGIINSSGILNELGYKVKHIKNTEYADTYLTKAGVTGDLYKKIMDLMIKTDDLHEYRGKDPAGLIAGAMYLVLKNNNNHKDIPRILKSIGMHITTEPKITQETFANYMEVTEVTLRTRVKQLKKTLKI